MLLLAVAVGAFAVPALTVSAYGHGLGGDVAPPVDFAGMSVTVSTQLTPSDITVGDISTASMAVRLFDQDTDETLEKVTYRIAIWRNDELLARHLFYDADGTLNIDIRPVLDCNEADLVDCTKYYGTEHPTSPGALYTQGTQNPVIQGPIFDKGGLYNIKVDVEGATSPRTLLTSPISFDTFVSVAQEQPFTIQSAEAEIPVVVKTYYDDVENFGYSAADGSISFDMPFDWSPEYVEQVALIHEELQVPKSFELYGAEKQFSGFVNGIEVDSRVLILDPYSYDDKSVLHFLVTGNELRRISSELDEESRQNKIMSFRIVPEAEVKKNTLQINLVDIATNEGVGANVDVSWDAKYGAGDEIPFELAFLNDDGEPIRDVRYGYILYNYETGEKLAEGTMSADGERGIWSAEGIDFLTLEIPSTDTHRLDIAVFGEGAIEPYDMTYAGIGSTLIEVKPETPAIPVWIKSSVGFWVDGVTSDAEFVDAIQYLIAEGIIVIPETEQGSGGAGIPAWIKSSVGFWVDGVTSDAEFVDAIQYLVGEGIIAV